MKLDAEMGDASGLEEDSFVDIDNIPSTKSDQEGAIEGTCMVGTRVEVVTMSERRAGRVVYGNNAAGVVK